MAENFSHAVIVLAAGASRRMGQPKQLLAVDGVPLLRRVVQVAIEAKIGKVWVVLGANAEKVRPVLAGLPVETVVNEAWEEGMGASIRAGMAAIGGDLSGVPGVIIVLGDQPEVSAGHLIQLSQAMIATGKSIVASRCAGRLSPPVLFGPGHFSILRQMKGDAGAKGLLEANPDGMAIVDTGDLGDLDTPDDYAGFLNRCT